MFRPDRLELQYSPVLSVLVVGSHLLAILAIWLSALTLPVQLLLVVIVIVQAIYLNHRYVWLGHSRSIRSIHWTDTQWFVCLADGSQVEVVPTQSCRVYGWLALLRFRSLQLAPGRVLPLCYDAWLLSGNHSQQAIRRLRVQLIQTGSNQN